MQHVSPRLRHQPRWRSAAMWRVILTFILPLLSSALLALPAYLLGIRGLTLSILVYVGQGLGTLALAWRWFSLRACGLTQVGNWQGWAWASGWLGVRVLLFVLLIPITAVRLDSIVIGYTLYFVFCNALVEEWHFRGVLDYSLQHSGRTRSPLWAAVVGAMLFALLHSRDTAWLWLPVLIADALAWATLRWRAASIYPAVVAHGLLNAVTIMLLVTPANLPDVNAWVYLSFVIICDGILVYLRLPRSSPLEAV